MSDESERMGAWDRDHEERPLNHALIRQENRRQYKIPRGVQVGSLFGQRTTRFTPRDVSYLSSIYDSPEE